MGLPPSGRVGVGAGDQVAGDRRPVAVAGMGGAGRAVPGSASGVLDGAFGSAGAFAEADQGEADPGLPDDLDQAGARAWRVPGEPVQQVLGPAGVVPGVLVRLVEVEQVDDAGLLMPGLDSLPGHGRVLQSTTQATGHAVPQLLQVRAISVMPSPVSTSDSVMSSDPQSGQTWAWNRTRSSVTAAHPCRGCRRGSAGHGQRRPPRGW